MGKLLTQIQPDEHWYVNKQSIWIEQEVMARLVNFNKKSHTHKQIQLFKEKLTHKWKSFCDNFRKNKQTTKHFCKISTNANQ